MIPPDGLQYTSDVPQKWLSTQLCGEHASGLFSFCTEWVESDRKSNRIGSVFKIKHVQSADNVSFIKTEKHPSEPAHPRLKHKGRKNDQMVTAGAITLISGPQNWCELAVQRGRAWRSHT